MVRKICFCFCVIAFALMLTLTAQASVGGDIPDSYLTWEIYGDTLTVRGTGAMPNLGHFGMPWFHHTGFELFDVTSVIIEDGVTTVGDFAFFDLPGPEALGGALESLIIGNDVEVINNWAFAGNNLESIILSSSLAGIGDNAFNGSPNLESVYFTSATPPTMAANAFAGSPTDPLPRAIIPRSWEGYTWEGAATGDGPPAQHPFVEGTTWRGLLLEWAFEAAPTGIRSISPLVAAMLAFVAISAVSWGFILRKRFHHSISK